MAKFRTGFVSNSSSSSFIITNLSPKKMTMEDFALETIYLVKEFNEYYDADITLGDFFTAVEDYNYEWEPFEALNCIFGDEDCNALGRVYDYMLRDDGCTNSFKWYLKEMLR